MAEFFDMGGKALYVWSAYGAAAIILLWNVCGPRRRHKQTLKRLAKFQKQREQ